MADNPRSLQDLIEELGFPQSERGFLLRLFGSSDPFAGLSIADIEPSRSNQSSRLSSTSLARRIASLRLSDRANRLSQSSTRNNTSDYHEGLEDRNPVHYEAEWVSLISAESETLISELLQYLVSDDEAPQPGFPELASSSVYDSDTGEPPDSLIGPDPNPGNQGDHPILPGPGTSTDTVAFEEILESFPRPPTRDSTVGERVFPDIHRASRQVIPPNSAQANISTLDSSEGNACTSQSRFTESLPDDSSLVGEQKSPGVQIKEKRAITESYPNADPSTLNTSALGNTPASSPSISPPSSINSQAFVEPRRTSWRSPSCSFREVCLPVVQPLGPPSEPEDRFPSKEHTPRYSVFPRLVSSYFELDYTIGRRHPFNTDFIGCRTPTQTPRYYRHTPLRISSRASTISVASKAFTPAPKPKRDLKFVVEKLKTLLRRIREITPSLF